MEDPTSSPLNPESNLQIEQNVDGDGSQLFGNITGHHITIATINNYHYQEQLRSSIDDGNKSVEADLPCPYRGLFHFGPRDAEYFFGRENFVEELVRATQTRSFIPLLGASGSGKSSVVLAGLVPKLQQAGHWQFTHFRPGADPFHALALALVPLYTTNLDETEQLRQSRNLAGYFRTGEVLLADVFAQIQQNYPTDRVLLIADQFEELYTLCSDEATRRNFLDKLLAGIAAPTDHIPFAPVLVATMRADFLGNALSYRPFADVLQNADLKLGPMNRAELTEVIEKPAQKLGVVFEAGLVERILGDVEKEPGILPLLEFALTELWQRRSGKQLTHAAYEEIGEVQGALARHANQEYGKLSEADRERVRRIFIQLVRPGEGAEDTRRIATKGELEEESWSLVKQLADARLVVTSRNATSQETVEVVHEALIRSWGELRGWMEIDRVFRAWQERLRGAMRQWQEMKQDEGSLLRGAALAKAEEQLRQRPEELVAESGFIEQSLQKQKRIQQAETARQKREIKNARTVTVVSLFAFVVSSGLGIMAWKQTQQAELNLADVLSASALSLIEKGKELDAFIPAIRAGKILQNQQVYHPSGLNALQEALNRISERNRLEGRDFSVSLPHFYSVQISPNGKTQATVDDKMIKLWAVDTGQTIRTFQGNTVTFSPDEKTVATVDGKTIKLWTIATGKELQTFQGGTVIFSPDKKTVATVDDKMIKLWAVDTGQTIRTFQGNTVTFSPDEKTVATVDGKTIKLWTIATGKELQTFQGDTVIFSPDEKTVATVDDKMIKLWAVATGEELQTFQGDTVTFSPDEKTVATVDGKTIKLWTVATGRELRTFQGHQDSVHTVIFSSDGQTLTTVSLDRTIKWQIDLKLVSRKMVVEVA
jgi:hypothetical protein